MIAEGNYARDQVEDVYAGDLTDEEMREHMGWEAERAEDDFYENGGFFPGSWANIAAAANRRTRDVARLRVDELTQRSVDLPRQRRTPVLIDGESVEETLRVRLERETKELLSAAEMITQQLARRASQLEHLKRFPAEDPFNDGEVLRFEKAFPHTPDKKYSYVASRIDSLWYITGTRSPQAITWDKFVNWMGLGVSEIFRVRTNKKVIG